MRKPINLAATLFLIVMFCIICVVSDGATIQERIAKLQSIGQVSELQLIVREIESCYATNLPAYVSYRGQFDSALELLAITNVEAEVELKVQIHLVLDKQNLNTNPESATLLFRLKEASVRRLVRISSAGFDRESYQLLASFLGEIRRAIIPNYERVKVYDNVAPPITGGGPMSAGMDPEAIKDPKARAAYKSAIATNNGGYYQNRLQLDILPSLNEFVSGLFLKSLSSRSSQREFSSEELARLANVARLSQLDKMRIGIQEHR